MGDREFVGFARAFVQVRGRCHEIGYINRSPYLLSCFRIENFEGELDRGIPDP
jgi:hypothetical protein